MGREYSPRGLLSRAAGSQERARVVVLLACVLGLDSADVSMLGAIADKLERSLSLSNTELGLLVSVPAMQSERVTRTG